MMQAAGVEVHDGGALLLTEGMELRRLDAHFKRVLRLLVTRSPKRLSPVQRRARARHIASLDRYRERGVFPRNLRFPGLALPHFIDELGTRCAMGHLIEESGGRDVVHYVAGERNFARVRELVDIEELGAWLEANGLTLDEAGQIQPTYCGTPAQNCVCGNAFSSGMVRGVVGDAGASLTVAAVYGPAVGAKIGDVVPLTGAAGFAGPDDIVFARWSPNGSAFAQFVAPPTGNGGDPLVTVPSSVCWYPQVASIPGKVPLSVMDQALSAANSKSCEAVLATLDPKWEQMQGGPDCTGAGGGGGTSGGGGASTGGGSGASGTGARPSSDSDGGCSISGHSALGAEALLAVSAALVVHQVRRRVRRRQSD